MRVELWLASKFIFRNKKRHISFITTVTSLGVALGVCSLIVVLAVMNGFDENLKEKLLGFNFHLVAYLDEFNPVKLKEIEDLKDVENVVLFSQLQTAVKKGKNIVPVVFEGIRFNQKEKMLWKKYLKKGNYKKLAIGNILAQNLGLNLKDKIKIFNPKDFKPHDFTISGIFNFGIYDLDANFLICPLSNSKNFFKEAGAPSMLGIRTKDIRKVGRLKKEIISKNIEGISIIRTWVELNQALFSALKLEKVTMFIILSLIILVACFNIFATQTVRVVEKVKDIGILKSIGLSKRAINLLFCLQGVILGLIGIFLGTAGGLGLCFILEKYHFIRLPSKIYYIEYLPVSINYKDVLSVCIVALAMSLIFSLTPSIRASRIKETQALRYE